MPNLSLAERVKRKAIAAGARAYFAAAALRYRIGRPWRGKLGRIDHVTLGVTDLAAAEAFYVGLLGARVAMRIDRALLTRMGWSAAEIERNRAIHLSLTFGTGPRLDLFEYPSAIPPEAALHPTSRSRCCPGGSCGGRSAFRARRHGRRADAGGTAGPGIALFQRSLRQSP